MGHFDGSRIYREAPGLVETAVVCDHDTRRETVTLRFWHPSVTERFSSQLVDPINLAISGDERWERITRRVARRLKPIGFIGGSRSEVEQAIALVHTSGGHGRIAYQVAGCDAFEAIITINGTVGSVFDLAALIADYQDYLAAGPRLAADVANELQRLSPQAFTDFDFNRVEAEWTSTPNQRRPGSLARCGLLLGYPVATTAALILGDHGLPGGYTQY